MSPALNLSPAKEQASTLPTQNLKKQELVSKSETNIKPDNNGIFLPAIRSPKTEVLKREEATGKLPVKGKALDIVTVNDLDLRHHRSDAPATTKIIPNSKRQTLNKSGSLPPK